MKHLAWLVWLICGIEISRGYSLEVFLDATKKFANFSQIMIQFFFFQNQKFKNPAPDCVDSAPFIICMRCQVNLIRFGHQNPAYTEGSPIMKLHDVLTLLRVPKNNHVNGFLGSILTPTLVLGSFLTPADVLRVSKGLHVGKELVKYEGLGSSDEKIITRFALLGSKLTPGTLSKVKLHGTTCRIDITWSELLILLKNVWV